MAELQSGEGRVMIDSVVWASYNNVTDKQTAINVTDRQPRCHNKCHANTLRRAIKKLRTEVQKAHVDRYIFFSPIGGQRQTSINGFGTSNSGVGTLYVHPSIPAE